MPLIDYIDGPNRDVYLSADTVGATIFPMDIYKEMRTLRAGDESLRRFYLFMSAFGNVSKGGGKATERFVQLNRGARLVPYDISHELTVSGTIITDDGQEGVACFDRTPLTSTTVVDINYIPPQVEIIKISGGSGLDATQDSILTSMNNKIAQLDFAVANQLSVNLKAINEVAVTGDGNAAFDSIWQKLLADAQDAGSMGEIMNAVLTINKYLALQK
jgi:hypothetical protein